MIKTLKFQNPDFTGQIERIRHACRGIVIKENRMLLCYQKNDDQYLIPGGGMEGEETLEECCVREVLEETGILCRPVEHYLDIEELFASMRHINHYYTCEIVEETDQIHLTEGEIAAGLCIRWLTAEEALAVFGTYEKYLDTNPSRFGLYRREYEAIRAWQNK